MTPSIINRSEHKSILINLQLQMEPSSSSSSSPPSNVSDLEIKSGSFDGKYNWITDLVWRNRTFKNLYVFYDQLAGRLGFSKSKGEEPIHSSIITKGIFMNIIMLILLFILIIILVKFPEKCFGVNAMFEEHLVILHTIDRVDGIDGDFIQSQNDILYFYFHDDSEVDRFRIVLSNALGEIQTKKRFLVVLNRESGQGRAGKVYEGTVVPMLQIASASFVLRESEYNRHISLFASQFDANSVDGIIIIGGDGTVNEFLNGLLNRKDFPAIQGNLPITIVPCGVKLQLASRFSLGDSSMAVFSALRAKTYKLYPIAFVQARRRFYGHSYLMIKPKKRTYIKLHYLNINFSFQPTDTVSHTSTTSSVDSIISKGPTLQFYQKFQDLAQLGKDVTTSTAAFGPNSDLQLTNTFDPSKNHPLALMSQSNRSNAIQKIWKTITCRNLFSYKQQDNAQSNDESWPRLLAMTKAGFLQIEDTVSYPPSQNKDRWYVDGEIIGTESVYFESLDTPVLVTVPPDYILEDGNKK